MISLYGLMSVIVLGSSICVLCDAAAMHARPSEWIYDPVSYIGKENPNYNNGIDNTSPFGWFLFCLLLWIIGFPLYLSRRPGLKLQAAAVKSQLLPLRPLQRLSQSFTGEHNER